MSQNSGNRPPIARGLDNTYINLPTQLAGCGALLPIAFVFICVLAIFGTKQVDAGETCVRLRFGDVAGTAGPGLNIAVPFADTFQCYSTRIVVYEVSRTPSGSNTDYTDFSTAFNTPDGQEAFANFTVIWRVQEEDAECVYRNTGRNMDEVNARAVKAITRSRVRLLSGRFTADQLFSGRFNPDSEVDVSDATIETVIESLQTQIRADIEPRLTEQCVTLDDFLLRKYDFNEDYVRSRERLLSAEADAERAAVEAQGEANAARLRAEGQADALDTVAQALSSYDDLTAQRLIQLDFIDNFAANITFGLVPDNVNPFIEIPGGAPMPQIDNSEE